MIDKDWIQYRAFMVIWKVLGQVRPGIMPEERFTIALEATNDDAWERAYRVNPEKIEQFMKNHKRFSFKNSVASKRMNLIGQKFGLLSVLEYSHKDKHGKHHWICQCDCGTTKSFNGNDLRSENTKSCGCLALEVNLKSINTQVFET